MGRATLPARAWLPGLRRASPGPSRHGRPQSTSSRAAQSSLPCSYWRGGTSRALFFQRQHLPAAQGEWAGIFRGALGSPDAHGRQLDGMGGGISSLSKVCVVLRSAREDADVDFAFAAVDVWSGEVDRGAACGNMSAAVGPMALDAGILGPEELGVVDAAMGPGAAATVRIFDCNTGKIIHASFPVVRTAAGGVTLDPYGDLAIDGVAGTAAPIRLAFLKPQGSKTGLLLPTSTATSIIKGYTCTLVDVGNPAVFVDASSFPSLPHLSQVRPDDLSSIKGLLAELDAIRKEAAVMMGLCHDSTNIPIGYPKISLVSTSLPGSGVDLTVRSISVGQPHKAIPITSALAVAAAARVRGSVVQRCLSEATTAGTESITIGHASGSVVVGSRWDYDGNLVAADVYRSARKIMEGTVFWRP